jgi:hypothetical protein
MKRFQNLFFDILKPKPSRTIKSNPIVDESDREWERAAIDIADNWLKENVPEDLMKFLEKAENENIDKDFYGKYLEIDKNKYTFKKEDDPYEPYTTICNYGDWYYYRFYKEFLAYHFKDIDSIDQLETIFEKYEDDIPGLEIIENLIADDGEPWSVIYSFQLKEYRMYETDAYSDKLKLIKLGKSWTSIMKKFKG